MVASECAPVAAAGGLGQVVFGLSRELELRGHAVEIILPKYDCLRYDQVFGLTVAYEDLRVPWHGGSVPCTVWFGFVHGRKCFFIEPHSPDNFFGRGHHWQTAAVPVLLYEIYRDLGMGDQRVCYTIHNFAHQGIGGEHLLWETGLTRPAHFFDDDRLRDNFNHGAINLMKGGIVYSNFITTVSPEHAREATGTDQGMGLGHTLHIHRGKFGGVLNGIDYEVWNPEIDILIPANYTAGTAGRKYANKDALRDRLLLRKEYKPVIAYVGRVDRQKGVHLIEHALFYALAQGAQFVLLGSCPEPDVNARFWQLKHYLNDNPDCHLELGFDEGLAHLIYAGADLLVMPSLFEPCGLSQLIALKYGTVPIVRAIGGLADTVFDRDYSARHPDDRNGYVFHQVDNQALESAMARAIGLWFSYPGDFRRLMLNGMRQDHSWAWPGQHYVNIYDHIRSN